MGPWVSIPNDRIMYPIDDEVDEFVAGNFAAPSIRYRMLLHAGCIVCQQAKQFKGHPERLCTYLRDLGPMKRKDARNCVTSALKMYESPEEAKEGLRSILTAMRIRRLPSRFRCISPAVDRDIYMSVMKGIDQSFWDPENPPILFNFSDPDVVQERARQWNEDRSECCDPVHIRNAWYALVSNSVPRFWRGTFPVERFTPVKTPPRPAGPVGIWCPSMVRAFERGKRTQMRYILWLIPELMYLPIGKEGVESIVHYAASSGSTKFLYLFREFGYDFSMHTSFVWDPIHVACQSVRPMLERFGAVYNTYDENGRSYLHEAVLCPDNEIRRVVVRSILMHGEDLSRTDSTGAFWMQWALHTTKPGRKSTQQSHALRDLVCETVVASKSPIYDEGEIRRVAKLSDPEALSEFKQAVQDCNLELVKALLVVGKASADALLPDGTLPLAYCVRQTDPKYDELAEILVANFANPNSQECDGANVFRVACVHHNFRAAEALLERGADASALANDGTTVMHWAYQEKDFDCLEFCLTHCNVNCVNKDGLNITCVAFLNRDDAMAERLQDKYGGDIQCQDVTTGNSLAHLAFEQRDIGRLSYLIARHIDLELQNKKGFTVLMEAVKSGEISVCELLIRHGANVNATRSDGLCPLHLTDDCEIVKLLVDNGCNINQCYKGLSKLMQAARDFKVDLFRLLLERGADVNIQGPRQRNLTALHLCLLDGEHLHAFLPVIDDVISKMDNLEARTTHGQTPFLYSADLGNLEICQKLIATGRVDPKAVDNNDRTALLIAASAPVCNRDLFYMLMDSGCDVNIPSKEGKLPLAGLIEKGHHDLAMELIRDPRCTVIDMPKSKFSPILMALDQKDKVMFEELVSRGVTAQNSARSVVVEYCSKSFFDFTVFQRLRSFNVIVGGPVPQLMSWNKFDVARYLWDCAVPLRPRITCTRDGMGRTPLMVCIVKGKADWVEELMSKGYNVTAEDLEGQTTLQYCAKSKNLRWTQRVYSMISAKAAGSMDQEGYSAMTYAAMNGWRDLCDQMFLDGVELPKMWDNGGIISHYWDVERAMERVKDAERTVKRLEDKINSIEKDRDHLIRRLRNAVNESVIQNLSKELDRKNERIAKLNKPFVEKCAQLPSLKLATRRDWLHNTESLSRLARQVAYLSPSMY